MGNDISGSAFFDDTEIEAGTVASSDSATDEDHEIEKNECSTSTLPDLTGLNFLDARKSTDERLLSKFIYLEDAVDAREQGRECEDCFVLSGDKGNREDLALPLTRTLRELYRYSFFVVGDESPVNQLDPSNSENLGCSKDFRHSLWHSNVVLVFLSRNFHKSNQSLMQLYTVLYRQQNDPDFILRIIFCQGMDPGHCKNMDAYQGLNLGGGCATLSKEYTGLEDFATGLHVSTVNSYRAMTPNRFQRKSFSKHGENIVHTIKGNKVLLESYGFKQVASYRLLGR